MKVRPLAYLSLCLGLALAACTPETSEWTETEAPKELHVDHVRLRHIANFAPNTDNLAAGETEKLTEFLETAEVTPEDRVYFEPAENDRLSAARIGKLTRELSRHGVGAATLPAVANGVPPNHMNIYVDRYVVTPPKCPNWTEPAIGIHTNGVSSNFGCADATNLGLMVANPRDLVIGRRPGAPEGDPALAGIDRYRRGVPKELSTVSASSTYGSQSGGAGAGGAGAGGAGAGGGQ
ncbi:MAG TPA: CpaD family pilus assembly lipoprotein [Stellaceae bacterium]|nr:CpaD family pilus assembly lipoprotein [Stellaceae bacterium]